MTTLMTAAGRAGKTTWPEACHRFAVPHAGTWRLRSRAQRPAHIHADHPDHRLLGVAVASLALDGNRLALDGAPLGDGWHEAEDGLRWTDGDAALHLAEAGVLDVGIALAATRWTMPEAGRGNGCASAMRLR